jgi:hypothetical protein
MVKVVRGEDGKSAGMFSYVRLEERVPRDHPLRAIRVLFDAALAELSPAFAEPYARDAQTRHRGRPLVEWFFVLTAAASNLIRIPKLLAAG